MLLKSAVKNEVLQNYVSKKPNDVICIDISYINKKNRYLVGIDLATRVVVGHFFKSSSIETCDVLTYLSGILNARSFIRKVVIVHSDRESLFTNDRYYDFLKSRDVKVSRGSSSGHQNQVVERLHRTLKFNLKKHLSSSSENVSPTKSFRFSNYSVLTLKQCLNEVIEKYNNTPHKHNFNLSPNGTDEAFFAYYHRQNALVPVRTEALGAEVSSVGIQEVRKEVALSYANNWEAWFLHWRDTQAVKDERLFTELLELKAQNSLLHDQLSLVAEEAAVTKKIRTVRETRKAKRLIAAKLPLRDVVSSSEFTTLISLIKSNKFSCCRRRLALCLLYLTGLRVSNLLVLNVKHVKSLMKEGFIEIPLIKRGSSRHRIELSSGGLELLLTFKQDFDVICKNKTVNDPLFSSLAVLDKVIARQTFDGDLNKVLIKASSLFGKHLRTHSFRATFITDLLSSAVPIDDVKELIGHDDIKSTLTYKRSRLTQPQIQSILKRLDSTRHGS